MKSYKEIKETVWCPTIEDANKLLKFLTAKGFETPIGSKPIDIADKPYKIFKENTCYHIENEMVTYESYNYSCRIEEDVITIDHFFYKYMSVFCDEEVEDSKEDEIIDNTVTTEEIGNGDDMHISLMIKCIKIGHKCRRKSWKDKRFIYYVPAAKYDAVTDVAKSMMDTYGKVAYKEYIAIKNNDGEVGFYTPTQEDLFATDWEVFI